MHAIISGAGVAGLALAGLLARAGWGVDVVERAEGPRTSGYLIDFFGPGLDAAERTGLLPALRERAESFAELRSVDAAGHVRGRIPMQLIERALAGRYLTILRPEIVAALADALPGSVRLRWGVQVDAARTDAGRVGVTLSDGECLDGDLLVGADGIGSRVRHLLWGPREAFVRPIERLIALAWIGDDPGLAADLGGRVATQIERDRQLVVAPLGTDRVTGFAVLRGVAAPDALAAIEGMGVLGRRAVPAIHEPYLDDVAQSVVEPWVRGPVVLLGDAGAAVSLLAGQGASLALAGAERLAAHLASATDAAGVAAGLAAFERGWRPLIEREQARGRRAAATFAPHSRLRLLAQHAVMRAAGVPGVAALVARAAGGVTKR